MHVAPTVTVVNRLFCVGLRGLNNPDIVATDVDPPPPGPTQSGLYSQRLQQSGSGAGSCRWMVARSRSVLQEQTGEPWNCTSYKLLLGVVKSRGDGGGRLEVLVWRSVAVVWRCSSGGPWRSSGGARREVHGGRLVALAAGGGKERRTEAEVLEAEASLEAAVAWRSWRRPTWKGRPGGPGGGVLDGPAAASWRARRRRPGGPGGGGSSSSKAKLFSSAS
ncbi:unnamed protein product [Arctogadus glacialis]